MNSKEIDLEYIRSFKSRWPKLIEAADHPLTELLIERKQKGIWPYLPKPKKYLLMAGSFLLFLGIILFFEFMKRSSISFGVHIWLINIFIIFSIIYPKLMGRKKKFGNAQNPKGGLLRILNTENNDLLSHLKLTTLSYREIIAIETVSKSLFRYPVYQKWINLLAVIFVLFFFDLFVFNNYLKIGERYLGYRLLVYGFTFLVYCVISYYQTNIKLKFTLHLLRGQIKRERVELFSHAFFTVIVLMIAFHFLINIFASGNLTLFLLFCVLFTLLCILIFYLELTCNNSTIESNFEKLAKSGQKQYDDLEF